MDINLATRMRLQEWAEDYAEWKASGLTQKEWCQIRRIPLHTFEYRCRRVRKTAAEIEKFRTSGAVRQTAFVEVPIPVEKDPPRYEPVRKEAAMVVHLHNATVEIADGTSPETIRTILEVLTHAQ